MGKGREGVKGYCDCKEAHHNCFVFKVDIILEFFIEPVQGIEFFLLLREGCHKGI
jgi:hypothetical protein